MQTLLTIILVLSGSLAVGQPVARHLERIAYDASRCKLVMYGGGAIVDGRFVKDSTVHEWDSLGWKEISAAGPGPRLASAMVYDHELKRTVLIGGNDEDERGLTVFHDVWTWDGSRWTPLDITIPLKDPEAVYDPLAKRILIYGEAGNQTRDKAGLLRFELWELKDGTARRLSSNGPRLSGPLPIAFDSSRKVLVLVAPAGDKMETWEWSSGESWKISSNGGPAVRNRHVLVYHPLDKKTYLHGGMSPDKTFLNDFWEWDGRGWRKLADTKLAARAAARGVYADGVVIEYGGVYERGVLSNELWTLQENRWVKQN